MELREPIEEINEKLLREYGRSIDDGRANYRVVWSDDQMEKRRVTHNDRGEELIHPEIDIRPKYRQYIRHRFILEWLVPVIGETDLLEKVVYEPLWTFQNKTGDYLPPFFDGCKFLIDRQKGSMNATVIGAKYKEDTSREAYLANLQKVENELFGNETDVGDALAYGDGIVVPGTGNQN